jgi:hypothetical protein
MYKIYKGGSIETCPKQMADSIQFMGAEDCQPAEIHHGCRSCTAVLVSKTIILLHDEVRLHAANTIKTKVRHMRWEVLEDPAYSPYLPPCDFVSFGPLNQALKGRFRSDAQVKRLFPAAAVGLREGMQRLVTQWNADLNAGGDFE